jgi:hypothetical protein
MDIIDAPFEQCILGFGFRGFTRLFANVTCGPDCSLPFPENET